MTPSLTLGSNATSGPLSVSGSQAGPPTVGSNNNTKRECPITVAVRIRPPPDAFPFTHHCVQPSAHDPSHQVVVNFDAFADAPQGSASGGSPRAFTFDHVFAPAASQEDVYKTCVQPLLDQVVLGFNATVTAYGQTGSGKTFTMGTCPLSQLASSGDVEQSHHGDECGDDKLPTAVGIAPRLVQELIERLPDANQRLLRVSYIELYQEEVRDLLADASASSSHTVPSSDPYSGTPLIQTPISIREDRNGTIQLTGVSLLPCTTATDILTLLDRGSQARTTGETNMNLTSSRSHAIFSIMIEQYVLNPTSRQVECRESKLHLVDLAGSERQKRTLADGVRFKESIKINSGLLALGNVINALAAGANKGGGGGGDGAGHVPYRDSKLTRLLQDSLGGNSKTVLIACVSPMPGNAQESLNTLVYANRAKRIKNKPVVNTTLTSSAGNATPYTEPPLVVSPPHAADMQLSAAAVPAASAAELLALVDQLKSGLTQANGMIAELHAKTAPLFPPVSSATVNQLAAAAPDERAMGAAADLAREVARYLESSRPDPSRLTCMLSHYGVQVTLPARAENPPLSRSASTSLDALPPLPPSGSRPASVTRKPSGGSAPSPLRALSLTSPPAGPGTRRATTAPTGTSDGDPTSVLLTRVADLEAQVAAQTRDLERLGVQARDHRASAEAKARAAERAAGRAREAEETAAYWERKAHEAAVETEVAREEGKRVSAEWEACKRKVREMEDELAHVSKRGQAGVDPAVEDELVRLTGELEGKLAMIEELDASRKRTDHLSQKFRDKMVKLERELHSAEKQVDRLKSEKLEMDSEKNRLKHEYELKIQQISTQLTALRGRQKQHDKLVREKETKQRQIHDLQSEVDKLRERQAQLQAKVRAESDRLASAQAVHSAAMQKLERQHDEDQRKIKVLEGQVVALRKRVDSAASVSSTTSAKATGAAVGAGQGQGEDASRGRGVESDRELQEQQARVQELESIVASLQQDRMRLEDQVKDLDHYRLSNKELRLQLRALMATATAGAGEVTTESQPHHRHRRASHHHHRHRTAQEEEEPAQEILAAALVPLTTVDAFPGTGQSQPESEAGTPHRIRLSKKQLNLMQSMSGSNAAGPDQGRMSAGGLKQGMEEGLPVVV